MEQDIHLNFKNSLSFKLSILTLIFISIAIISFGAFSFYKIWNILLNDNIEKIRAVAKPIIEKYISKYPLKKISKNLARDLTSKKICCIILDKKGNIIANGKLLPEEPTPPIPEKFYITKALKGEKEVQYIKNKTLIVLIPLKTSPFSNKIIGVAQLSTSLDYIYSSLFSQGKVLLFVGIFTIILTAFVCFIVISKRMNELKQIVYICNEISNGNFSKRLKYSQKDEIGILIKSFNKMLDKIENLLISQQRFVSNASHELRTPLTAIKGSVEVMLKGALKNNALKEKLLKNILNEINRIIALSERLLMLTRLESIKLNKELINIETFFDELYEKVISIHKNKVIKLIKHKNCNFFADKILIEQVMLDLIDNSVKFTDNNGLIEIGWETDEKFLKMFVKDNGYGIPKNELSKIFEPFYQIKKKKKLGFGLGLSIVKTIIKAHNGEIKVKSCLNKGTSVYLILPLK